MFVHIFKMPTMNTVETIEVFEVSSKERAIEILQTSPDLYNLKDTMVEIGAPRKSRLAFYSTSWCHFYAPGSVQGLPKEGSKEAD